MDNSQLIEEIRRGKALIKLGLLADARVLFQGLSAQPKAAYECALNLGLICFRQKEFGDAKKLFRRASKIEPKKFMPHYNLGVAFRELGDHESAIRSFKKAIGLDP
ncbi:MAG: tetratricopeptide repeat protein, partial [Opitutae bacterium]